MVQAAQQTTTTDAKASAPGNEPVRPNVATSFSHGNERPAVARTTFVDPHATVIGAVELGSGVYVAPGASVRGDEGQPIHVGAGANVQDGVVIHALETEENGQPLPQNQVKVGSRAYAVYIGEHVSLAHQSQVHGPALIGEHTFVGMQSLVFRAEVGAGCVLEPRSLVMGVKVAPGRYVPAGQVVTTQEHADQLPAITPHYRFARLNEGVLHVNHQLADGYRRQSTGERGTPIGEETGTATATRETQATRPTTSRIH
jgi:carbonic anhydrase/acetyltransferase-like protein (isoleucine patch superfamily)